MDKNEVTTISAFDKELKTLKNKEEINKFKDTFDKLEKKLGEAIKSNKEFVTTIQNPSTMPKFTVQLVILTKTIENNIENNIFYKLSNSTGITFLHAKSGWRRWKNRRD